MKKITYTLLAFLLPASAFAQATNATAGRSTIDGILVWLIGLIDSLLIPLVFSLALIFFLFGVFKYFFAGGGNEENRSEGKKFIIWSIIAFVVMISIWGVVNVITNTFGIQKTNRPALPCFSGDNCNTNQVPSGSRPSIGGN
jgi:hypothetical protein